MRTKEAMIFLLSWGTLIFLIPPTATRELWVILKAWPYPLPLTNSSFISPCPRSSLVEILSVGSIVPFSALCVTPVKFSNLSQISNSSQQLSQYLQGAWSDDFQNFTRILLAEITRLNSTRVQPASLPELFQTFSNTFQFTKQWAGIIGLLVLLLIGILLLFRKVRQWRTRQRVQSRAIVQAFMSIEAGTSPQIWLSMLGR
ncbi:uncharacterized protein LOC116597697 [Mustela erminea]|uniref:uncharacterized protein LOC116597697 n=1 Tax=Mustela erminea TaxID=36723 RepID=UPI001387147D|nr:uncharacterized protein LOC116597697 [Mustela erminea]